MFLYLFLIGVSFADDSVKVILTNKSAQTSIRTGETIDAEIIFLPYEKLEKFKIENFLNKRVFDHFFVSNIKQFEVSRNNPEAFWVESKLTLVSEPKENEGIFFTGGEIKIPVEIRNLHIAKSEIGKIEKFILIDQKVDPVIPWRLYSVLVLLGTVLVYWVIRKIKNFRKKQLVLKIEKESFDNKLKLWSSKFTNAKVRADFEEIFSKRDEWGKLKNSDDVKVTDFLECVKRNQYKRSWGESEYREINSYFLDVKNLFRD